MGAGIGPAFDDVAAAAARPGPGLPASYTARPRLHALLDALTQRRIALVVGPAGSGKSVAVAGWAAARPALDVRWVEADELRSDTEILASVRATPYARTVLVLDCADTSPDDLPQIPLRLREWGAGALPLLVIARVEPAWIPARLRLSGEVGALGYADLRFRRGEARDVIRGHRPMLTDAQAVHILDQSRGWAASLALLAESPPLEPALSEASSTPRALTEYLDAEVLLQLTPEMREVLASVSDEPHVDAEEVAVLSDIPDAARMLAEAAAEGFLVEPAVVVHDDQERPAWRMHALIAEVLRRRTAPDGPDRSTLVLAHSRAAEHYSRAGDAEQALQHAMRTGSLPIQLAALRKYALELIARGRTGQAADALDLIPTALRRRFLQTLTLDSIVLRGLGRYDDAKVAADRALEIAETSVHSTPEATRRRDVEADLAILDVWEARCGWRRPAEALARATAVLGCRHHANGGATAVDESHDTTGIAPLRSAWLMLDLAALELWRDDVESAGAHIGPAVAYGRQADLPRLLCSALSLRAVLQMAQGNYQSAMHTADSCLAVLAERELDGFTAAARAHAVRGMCRFHALDLVGAGEDLAALDRSSRDPFAPFVPVYRRLLAASLRTAAGDAPAARQLLDEEDTAARLPSYARRDLSVARMRAAAWMGDTPAMEAEVAALRDAGHDLDADCVHGMALGLRGEVREALVLFDRLLSVDDAGSGSQAVAGAGTHTTAAVAVARVAFLLRAGTPEDVNRARHLLPDALNRLAAQRMLWLVATGELVSARFSDLLQEEAGRVGGHPLAQEALAALGGQRGEQLVIGTGSATSLAREAAAIAGVTPRELDVLRALAQGGSNATIAAGLYVSENTVKTHLAALYRKLDADSRSGAVAAARRSGLL